MKKYKYIILIILFTLVSPFARAEWQDYSYQLTRVVDGDTIQITDGNLKLIVRFATTDAPEKKQTYGKVAKKKLEDLLLNKTIKVQPVGNGLGKYGRVIGIVYADGVDVGLEMIKEGLSAYYRPRCRDYSEDKKYYNFDPRPYVEAEELARKNKTRFWGASNELPCAYRKRVSEF